MKLIIAIIQPSRLEAVKAASTEVEVFRLTIMDVQGFGRQQRAHRSLSRPRDRRESAAESATANCRERRIRRADNQRHYPWRAEPANRAKSATARSSSSRSKTASASAPANAAAKRSDCRADVLACIAQRSRKMVKLDRREENAGGDACTTMSFCRILLAAGRFLFRFLAIRSFGRRPHSTRTSVRSASVCRVRFG